MTMRHAYLPLALGLGIAAAGIAAPGMAAADEKPVPRIMVVGEGETAANPDMAILSLTYAVTQTMGRPVPELLPASRHRCVPPESKCRATSFPRVRPRICRRSPTAAIWR